MPLRQRCGDCRVLSDVGRDETQEVSIERVQISERTSRVPSQSEVVVSSTTESANLGPRRRDGTELVDARADLLAEGNPLRLGVFSETRVSAGDGGEDQIILSAAGQFVPWHEVHDGWDRNGCLG